MYRWPMAVLRDLLAGQTTAVVSLSKYGGSAPPLENVEKRSTVGAWLESRVHAVFTEYADEMFGYGNITREERIALSNAIGNALIEFTATVEEKAPQLYERDRFDEMPVIEKSEGDLVPVSMHVSIEKQDEIRGLVFGWAKWSEDPENRGYLLTDTQGDVITPEDLEDSAYEYVLTSRDAGEMHVTKGAATLVESFMVTPEKLHQMGLEADALPIGWWVGYKVHDEDVRKRIADGTYTGFSVEGLAVREPVEVEKRELTDEETAERRHHILDLFRRSVITDAERERLLQELPAPEELRPLMDVLDDDDDDSDDLDTGTVLAVFRKLFGVTKNTTPTPEEVA